MSASNGTRDTVKAENLGLDVDAMSNREELARIYIHTPAGETSVVYDPDTLEVDPDIGVVCMAMQALRNMGQLADATIGLRMSNGPTAEFRLSEIVLIS